MSQSPFRILAVVPQLGELAPLWPWVWLGEGAQVSCPKCYVSKISAVMSPNRDWVAVPERAALEQIWKICTGKRVGVCRAGCPETREHFHVKCVMCGWRANMAAKDGAT